MQNTNKNKIWKIAVPGVALILATLFVLDTSGFDSVLKLLRIKASDNDTILLSASTDFLGTTQGVSWLVESTRPVADGAEVVDAYSALPSDMGNIGMIIPIFSSQDESENLYKTHTYTSPVLDLKANPYLKEVALKYHTTEGSSMDVSYRTDASLDTIGLAEYGSLSLADSSEENGITTATVGINKEVGRYFQFKIEFKDVTFDQRAALYELGLDLSSPTEEDVVTEKETVAEGERTFQIQLAEDPEGPKNVDLYFLAASNQGKTPVHTMMNQTSDVLSGSTVKVDLPSGAYALVVKSVSHETQVMPFEIKEEAQIEIKLHKFEKLSSATDYDLNNDGAVNSLDIQELLSKLGPI